MSADLYRLQEGNLSMVTSELALFLKAAVSSGCSDIHLSSASTPMARIGSDIKPLEVEGGAQLEDYSSALIKMLSDLAPLRCQSDLESGREVDFGFELRELARFRVNLYHYACTGSPALAAAIRIIPWCVPRIEELGLAPEVGELAHLESGLILITGATGSGKSTTLAALVDLVNREQARHIITIEDPIEFYHTPKMSVIHQREVYIHSASFASALRAGLRQDPDVIVLGELRDLETISLALAAAETGHLVLASMHAKGVVKSIERIIDVFPADGRLQARAALSEVLEGIVSQRLVFSGDGAQKGVVCGEVARANPALRTLIREGKTHQIPGLIEISRGAGMVCF